MTHPSNADFAKGTPGTYCISHLLIQEDDSRVPTHRADADVVAICGHDADGCGYVIRETLMGSDAADVVAEALHLGIVTEDEARADDADSYWLSVVEAYATGLHVATSAAIVGDVELTLLATERGFDVVQSRWMHDAYLAAAGIE